LLVVIGIAGMGGVFDDAAVRHEIGRQLTDLIGREQADMVESILAKSAASKHGGVVATVIGVVVLLVGATGVFAQLQDALDAVWNVKPDQTPGGIWETVKDRFLSFSMICGMAFLLLVSLIFST